MWPAVALRYRSSLLPEAQYWGGRVEGHSLRPKRTLPNDAASGPGSTSRTLRRRRRRALECIYNVLDDDPSEIAMWLPAFADAIGFYEWLRRSQAGA